MRSLIGVDVFATFEVEGFHYWPDAPDELMYLRDVHRHMFHVSVNVAVKHNNREIEIITLRRTAIKAFENLGRARDGYFYGSASCEMLAEGLGNLLISNGIPVTVVTVSEDGENGGIAYFEEPDDNVGTVKDRS
jgi:hypothetical protein